MKPTFWLLRGNIDISWSVFIKFSYYVRLKEYTSNEVVTIASVVQFIKFDEPQTPSGLQYRVAIPKKSK